MAKLGGGAVSQVVPNLGLYGVAVVVAYLSFWGFTFAVLWLNRRRKHDGGDPPMVKVWPSAKVSLQMMSMARLIWASLLADPHDLSEDNIFSRRRIRACNGRARIGQVSKCVAI